MQTFELWHKHCTLADMMSRRTIRIVALLLVILIASASTVFTYDVLLGTSITDTFVDPDANSTLDF